MARFVVMSRRVLTIGEVERDGGVWPELIVEARDGIVEAAEAIGDELGVQIGRARGKRCWLARLWSVCCPKLKPQKDWLKGPDGSCLIFIIELPTVRARERNNVPIDVSRNWPFVGGTEILPVGRL